MHSPFRVTKAFIMLTRVRHLQVLVLVYGLLCSVAITADAQTSLTELQKVLRENAAFAETVFGALARGETIVKLPPVQDKREIALSGLVNLRASAEDFLR